MPHGDATLASQAFYKKKQAINRDYRGFSRKLRLIIVEAEYALALHEGELGAPSVRKSWEERFEKLWRARRDPSMQARESLLHAVAIAEQNYSEPHVGWRRPRESFPTYMGKNKHGQVISHTMSVPFEDEAAEKAIAAVAGFDPETAAKIPPDALAALIPTFRDRHKNTGRVGKTTTIDRELCKLVRDMELGTVSEDTMRSQRLQFEEMVNQRKQEEARVRYLAVLQLEREQYNL